MKIRFAAMFALIIILSALLAFRSLEQIPNLMLSLFITGVASCCAVCAFRQFVHPLQMIIAYARQIADGNLTGSIEGKYLLELNELAAALQKMANTLGSKLAFMTSMLDNIPTPMAFIDPKGKITWLNKPMVDLIDAGGSPESHYGEDFSVFFYGDRRETVTEKAIRTRERHSLKGEVTSRKGTKKWISVASLTIFDPNGVLIGGFTSIFDFTRVVEKEQGMAKVNHQILEAVRTFEAISKELSKTGVSLGEDIAGVNKGMNEQKDRVNETVTAMEQMIATVLEVARNASEAAGRGGPQNLDRCVRWSRRTRGNTFEEQADTLFGRIQGQGCQRGHQGGGDARPAGFTLWRASESGGAMEKAGPYGADGYLRRKA